MNDTTPTNTKEMNEHILTSLTLQIYSRVEKESLKKIANKITKVPKSINIPVEYMVEKKGGE